MHGKYIIYNIFLFYYKDMPIHVFAIYACRGSIYIIYNYSWEKCTQCADFHKKPMGPRFKAYAFSKPKTQTWSSLRRENADGIGILRRLQAVCVFKTKCIRKYQYCQECILWSRPWSCLKKGRNEAADWNHGSVDYSSSAGSFALVIRYIPPYFSFTNGRHFIETFVDLMYVGFIQSTRS